MRASAVAFWNEAIAETSDRLRGGRRLIDADLMAHRKRVTVMAGDVPLYDAKIDATGQVFMEAPYSQPPERPVRYEPVQQDDLRSVAEAQATQKPKR